MPRGTTNVLPHGLYGLLASVLTAAGWILSLLYDDCNYLRVSRGSFTTTKLGVASSSSPHVHLGLQAYRVLPNDHDAVDKDEWNASLLLSTTQCLNYPESVEWDAYWKISKLFNFIALVLGGGATFYLIISLCCRFSRSSWRTAGYEVLFGCLFQSLSFLSLASDVCQTSHCQFSKGAWTNVGAAICWGAVAVLIFGHYPIPRSTPPIKDDGVMTDDTISTQDGVDAMEAGRRLDETRTNDLHDAVSIT